MYFFIKNSLFFLFSFLLLSFTIYAINGYYSSFNYLLILKYTATELVGLVLFISQFLYVIFENKINNKKILLNVIFYWVLYLFFKLVFKDINELYYFKDLTDFIFLEKIYTKNRLVNPALIYKFFNDVRNWDLDIYQFYSSFTLLLFSISSFICLKDILQKQILIRFISFIFLFLFYLYFWKSLFNVPLFLLSTLILKNRGSKT